METTNLSELSKVSIGDVSLDRLVDIQDITIREDGTPTERFNVFVKQIHNPYCFRSGKIAIKIGFADTSVTLGERMESYFKSL